MEIKPTVLIVMYGHPENYPPTLNAITCLSKTYNIELLHRAHQSSEWLYPAGVRLYPDGKILSARAQEIAPLWKKIGLFLRFCTLLWKLLRQHRPQVVLCYDSLGLFAYALVYRFVAQAPLLWYHNHDVYEIQLIRKYSLSWWAVQAEKWMFPKLSIFSLPALDRKAYFPMDRLGGQFFFLPNYPAREFYQPFYEKKAPQTEIRLIFQGQVGPGHGIEEIIQLLPLKIHGLPLKLVLKGIFRNSYDQWVLQQIQEKNLSQYIEMHGFTPYAEVPLLGSKCHIGLAIFTKNDLMNKTLGTASNKIYEYAALGLPIVYYDSPHFQTHLQQYPWAKATDLSADSIVAALSAIVSNYAALAEAAHHDFVKELNYEHYFAAPSAYLHQQLNSGTS